MRIYKTLLLLCFFAGSLLAQSPTTEQPLEIEVPAFAPPPPPPPPQPIIDLEEQIFRVVQEMPTFPFNREDCTKGRPTCGRAALEAYLLENTYYPDEALAKRIEGVAVVTFVVERDGQLSQVKVARSMGKGTGEEALRVVTQMKKPWLPGTMNGREVRVMYNLPIKFKIGVTKEGPVPQADSVYVKVDIPPFFPGSQSECSKTPHQCSTDAMLTYVYENVDYPDEAVAKGVYGMSVVKFVVEKDGTMTDLRVVRDPGTGTGDEALRVVQSIADKNLLWTPGEKEGKPVRTSFALPIKFALSKKQIRAARKRAKQEERN